MKWIQYKDTDRFHTGATVYWCGEYEIYRAREFYPWAQSYSGDKWHLFKNGKHITSATTAKELKAYAELLERKVMK